MEGERNYLSSHLSAMLQRMQCVQYLSSDLALAGSE